MLLAAGGGNARGTSERSTEGRRRAEVPRVAGVLLAAAAARPDRRPFPPRGFRLPGRRPGSHGGRRPARHASAAARAAHAARPRRLLAVLQPPTRRPLRPP